MSANTKSSKSHWVLIAVWEEAEEMKVTADDLHSRKTYAPNQQHEMQARIPVSMGSSVGQIQECSLNKVSIQGQIHTIEGLLKS